MRTAICDLFGIEYPVIQGGMAWLGTAELASAVSNGGGLGIIGAGNAPPSWIREQIRATREWTSKPFALNIMLMTPFLEEVIQVVLEEGVSIVTTGGGNPGVYIPTFKEAGIKVMPVVSSVALAKRLERAGADALVAEGLESGGHIGETATMALLPQVVDSVTIPVVAAGGIGDGRGLAAALCLGAQGVQLGTRFVCAEECVAHPNFKRKVLEARDRSTVATGYATGHPVRCIENRLTRQFQALERGGASVEELELLGQGKLELAALNGDTEEGSVMAGQIAGLITDIKPAAAIIKEIVDQAESIIARLSNSYVGVRHG
ncbi:MAG: enoyl-[acyl-carrier-protein] reductase FabK [Chloroflexi bacterium]|nr:enoyl-[acyl-carrier-protein] reductase FabK [Chloroflexota bacterium]